LNPVLVPPALLLMRNFRTICATVLAGVSLLSHGADAERFTADHGVVLFYEPKTAQRSPPDLHDTMVSGAEAIFWWGDIELRDGEYDWSRVDRELALWQAAGKRLDMRLATAHNSPFNAPSWLYDQYQVRRIGRGDWNDCENNLGSYQLEADGQHTRQPELVVSGNASIASSSTQAGRKVLCSIAPGKHLEPGTTFAVEFDYRAPESVTAWIEIFSKSGGVKDRQTFVTQAPARASQVFKITLPELDDCGIRFGYDGSGTFAVDNLNVIRLLDAKTAWQTTTFETGDSSDWILNGRAEITSDLTQVIAGRKSLLLTGDPAVQGAGVSSHPTRLQLEKGQGYAFEFDYRALTDATLRSRIISRTTPETVLEERTIQLKAGQSGRQHFYYASFIWKDDCRMEIDLIGIGQLIMDDLKWTRWSDRVACFPDYFNPVFQEKWTRFVTRFAERYARHPGLGTVSVGGFGRWEETILDDDSHGGLDAQWLARGFTPEKYLARITDCMDLYRRLLPETPLRICLAYGLYHQNPVNWFYRRTAQAAVARGISLKQNGWSEKWDTWDINTSASYLWNRYRYTPGITLTLETGGQISRPGPGAGHPISFFNRGLIDGTDIFFLYGSDTGARHINKYLRWANEQLGRQTITTMHCRIGDTSLTHEYSPVRMEYRNLWLGLRQFQDASANVIYTNRLGEMCAATSPGNPHIVLDVDDRQQYSGMNGVIFSVQYLDEGNDQFEINALNHWTGKWQTLGRATKTGTGQWRTASFYQPDWCRSTRNSGEDVHIDIVINDCNDGIEHITNAELNFVPAREWQRSNFLSLEPSDRHVALTNTLSREIKIPGGQPLNGVSVPLWTGNLEANALRGRVYALTAQGEQLVSEKEYDLPANGDWFELPVVPQPNCSRYRIELTQPKGSVGWYQSTNGELACRAWSYATQCDIAQSAANVNQTFDPSEQELLVNAASPFSGLRLNLPNPTGEMIVSAKLRRELPGSGWSEVITEQNVTVKTGMPPSLWFEPQSAGQYKLELGTISGAAVVASAGQPLASLHYLTRRVAARPALPIAVAKGQSLFQPSAAPSPIWGNSSGLEIRSQTEQQVTAHLTAGAAAFELALNQPVTASTNQMLALQLANQTGAPLLRVFWAGRDQSFDPTRSLLFPIVQNDTELREYQFPIGFEENWRGRITRLRVEIASVAVTRGVLSVGAIRLIESPEATALANRPQP
jgi:hypothetical protein